MHKALVYLVGISVLRDRVIKADTGAAASWAQ